jgi:4-hydroxy-tetrahydrodipicolinate synthase
MTTDKSIDWHGLDRLVEWYLDAGVAGLFAVGLSSEMYFLTNDERLSLAKRVVERVRGRVPVVATGNFGGSLNEQVTTIKRMAETGVQAVTVVLAALAPADQPFDVTVKRNLEFLLIQTGDCPLALYECPLPYHRLASPDLLAWAARSGRFLMLKETSRSLPAVLEKCQATAGTPLKCLNADATTLLDSLEGGAQGYCGIAANFYPRPLVSLCDNFQTHPDEARRLQSLLGAFDTIIHQKYPLSAKIYLRGIGLVLQPVCRTPVDPLDDYDRRVLDHMAGYLSAGSL